MHGFLIPTKKICYLKLQGEVRVRIVTGLTVLDIPVAEGKIGRKTYTENLIKFD